MTERRVPANKYRHNAIQYALLLKHILEIYGYPYVIQKSCACETMCRLESCNLAVPTIPVDVNTPLPLLSRLLDLCARQIAVNRYSGVGVVQIRFQHR